MAQPSFAVKRAHPRFKLFADAEATLRDGTSILGQLTELSAGGCYIHTLELIAIGTPFELRISDGIRSCELRGKAIYMHSGNGFGIFGVGVKFESMAADQRSILDTWLRELGPSFHPASGKCDVQECVNPAKYRAIWLRSRTSKLVCETHKQDMDGKPFTNVSHSFDSKRSKWGDAVAQARFTTRRVNPRFAFSAEAEFIFSDGTLLPGQLSELSADGCNVDTLTPIHVGTELRLRISDGKSSCELPCKVIYLNSGGGLGVFGVGVLFGEMTIDQYSVIDGWLRERART